jgi:hypothetical protein
MKDRPVPTRGTIRAFGLETRQAPLELSRPPMIETERRIRSRKLPHQLLEGSPRSAYPRLSISSKLIHPGDPAYSRVSIHAPAWARMPML